MSNFVNKKRRNCWLSTKESRFGCQLFTVVWESQVPSSQGLWGQWEMVTPWAGGRSHWDYRKLSLGPVLLSGNKESPSLPWLARVRHEIILDNAV